MQDDGKPWIGANSPFVTYLDHDHRERENIRLFTIRPYIIQDLGRSPSRGMALIARGTLYGIRVLGDRSETKICDPCMAGGIHKDIWLDTYQYGGKAAYGRITHSFEITVNYIAGVEEVKALSDIT